MSRPLWLLALCQGLFLTNNVVFIAINGLVGLSLAPLGWMATLPVMGYVVGGALSTNLVAATQSRFGRKHSFQLGLLVALGSALYIGSGLGPGPRDGIMTGLAARGVKVRVARTGIEVTVLAIGWLLGGQVGVGTVLFALAIGPLVAPLLPRLSMRPKAQQI